jgi:hypothetical protein
VSSIANSLNSKELSQMKVSLKPHTLDKARRIKIQSSNTSLSKDLHLRLPRKIMAYYSRNTILK